jgi:HEAT repeat protein
VNVAATRWCAAVIFAALLPLTCGAAEELNVVKLAVHLEAGEREARRDASYHLARMGPEAKEAIPALIKALGDEDKQVWANSIAALANLGPLAEPAIPVLLQGLESRGGGGRGRRQYDRSQIVLRTAHALSRIGVAAVPALMQALKSEETTMRLGAIKALGGMQAAATPAIPELVNNLGHGDAEVRRDLIETFGLIGEPAVKPLQDALGSQDARAREVAALSLASIGRPLATPAAARLLEVAEKDQDDSVKAAALAALPRVGADPATAVPLALAGLKSSDEGVRRAATNSLLLSRSYGRSYGEKAVPALVADLRSDDATVRQRSAQVLGRMNVAAREAVPALIDRAKKEPAETVYATALAQIGAPALDPLLKELTATSEKDFASRAWVFRALKDMGSPAMDALVPALDSPQPAVRAGAVRALEGMPLTPPLVKRLVDLSADNDPKVRAATLRTLAFVRSQRDVLVPKLESGLNDGDAEVRRAAAVGLAAIGSVERIGAKGLIELLGEPDVAIQRSAINALGIVGAAAAPAVPMISERLGRADLRITALEALGKIGPGAAPAVPQLLELAKSGDEEVRLAALQAIGNIGENAEAVLPILYDGLKSQNRDLRIASVQILAKVERSDEKLMPVLTAALQDESGRVRRIGVESARRLKDRAEPLVPYILPLLDREPERPGALSALREIPVRAVQPLTKALGHRDQSVRLFACDALAKLGAAAEEAIPELEKRASEDSEQVKSAAKKALEKIRAAMPAAGATTKVS